jgi:hypothetical protein
LGGGLLARFDFDNQGRGKNYLEASLRGGKLKMDFQSADFINGPDVVTYESGGQYFGGHLAIGRIFNFNESKTLDFYGKYLVTALSGDQVLVAGSTPVSFNNNISQRLRGGVRFGYNLASSLRLVTGLGYEYEFDGKTVAQTQGWPLKTLKHSGGTALAELGLSLRLAGNVPMTFTLGGQGFLGQRDGVNASLQLGFEF